MPDVGIRRATPEDVPALIALYREFHTFHVNGLPLWLREPEHRDDEQLRAALLDILANDAAAIFVVEADGAGSNRQSRNVPQSEPGEIQGGVGGPAERQ